MGRGVAKFQWYKPWVQAIFGVMFFTVLACAAPVLALSILVIGASTLVAAIVIGAFATGKAQTGRARQRGYVDGEYCRIITGLFLGVVAFIACGVFLCGCGGAASGSVGTVAYDPQTGVTLIPKFPKPTPTPAVAYAGKTYYGQDVTTVTVRLNADGRDCPGGVCPALPTPSPARGAWYNGFQ